MLDRHTPDCINPVFLRHLRTMHRSGIIWLLAGFAVLAQVLFFYNARLCAVAPQTAPLSLFGSAGVLLVLAMASLLISGGAVADTIRKERGVDGMDPSIGTALTPRIILVGQVLAMLASQAVVAIAYVPGVVFSLAVCESTPKLLLCSVAAMEAVLFILLATVQASQNGKGAFSPLWLLVAGVLVPMLIWSFAMAIMALDSPQELKEECYLLGQLMADASVIALSCAAIYGENRSRVMDITTPLHRTALVLWLLWMPFLWPCFADLFEEVEHVYLDGWAVLSVAFIAFLCMLVSIEPLAHSRMLLEQTRQRHGARRWLWLLLQGGVVPGYLLTLAVVVVMQLVMGFARETLPGIRTLLPCYGLFYCGLVLWLRKTFRISPGMAYVVLWMLNIVIQSFGGALCFGRGYQEAQPAGRLLAQFMTGELFISIGGNGRIFCSPWVAGMALLGIALWYSAAFKPFLKQLKKDK